MTLLVELTESQRALALKRFNIIKQCIEGGATRTEIAERNKISISTVKRWITQYNKEGLLGLVRKTRKDFGIKKCSELLIQGIEALVLHRPQLTAASIHRIISKYAIENGEHPPSYSLVSSYISKMPTDLKTLAHFGSKKYDDLFELLYLRDAERSNQIWQVDHTQLDIIVLDSKGNEVRPWLTIVLDDKSRAIAGYYIALSAPSTLNTALALRQAIWRKEDPLWPVCGIPEILYTDHGSDFTSQHIEQVCADLKIRLIFSSVGKPRGRGKVERFFETINQMLLSTLPGYTKSTWKADKLITKDALESQLRRFLLDEYHHKIHPSLNISPLQSWYGNGFLPQLPESYEQLDLLLLTVSKSRMVRNTGISFLGLKYHSQTLAAYIGEPIIIRYDPRDISEIRVFYHHDYLCNAICPELSEHSISLDQIKKARIKRKQELRKTIRDRRSLIDLILVPPKVPVVKKKKIALVQPKSTSRLKIYENE